MRLGGRVGRSGSGDDDAEDVAQDAFQRAFHGLDRFRGEAPFRAWLLSLTHNTALSTAGKLAKLAPSDLVDDQGSDVAVERDPAERLELRERLARLDVKLKGLSPEHRMVLVLRDVEGLTYDEIARITGTPLTEHAAP